MMRPTIILLVIAAILMAVVVCVPILALPLVIVTLTFVALRRTITLRCDAQPLALVTLVLFRAPPA
jgi:hypothetical protein